MSNTDSSAIVRLIQVAQQEPIFEAPPINDTLPTEMVEMDEIDRPARSYRGYFLTALVAVAIGIGGAFYVVDRGSAATASAKDGLAGVMGDNHRSAPAPAVVAAPVVEPAAVTPAPAAEPAAAALPEVALGAAEQADPAVADSPAAAAEPALAAPGSLPPEPAPIVAPPVAPIEEVATEKKSSKKLSKAAKKRAARKARRKAKRKAKRAAKRKAAKKRAASAAGSGTLMISAKPPCRIYIDGRDTKLTSPQRSISLKPGKHKVSLVNREYKIKTTATVIIKAGKRTKVIKDMSSRIK